MHNGIDRVVAVRPLPPDPKRQIDFRARCFRDHDYLFSCHFRHFLSEIGWEIVREEMIKEDGKFYPMMKAVRNNAGEKTVYTEEEAWFGPLLLKKCHPVLKEYLLREEMIRKKILAGLSGAESASAKSRLAEVKEEMELIKLALGRYESI